MPRKKKEFQLPTHMRAYELKSEGKKKLIPDAKRMTHIVRALEVGESVTVKVKRITHDEWLNLL